MDRYLESYREMISLRGLTGHTLISYTTYIRAYLDYLQHVLHKLPEDVSWQEMRDFVRWLQRERSLSDRTVNCAVSQMRFFTLYVLHKPWDDTQLPMRRFDEYLPYVPSQQETWHFISTMPGLKQKAMVALMYSSGLRIGEVCSLRYEDVSRSRMRVFVRHGKNRQSRYAILSKAALDILTLYWRITCHSFRHAFGTHLYENGTDLLTIKALMGHKSVSSTAVYVHLAGGGAVKGAVSPFDRMGGMQHGQA